MSGLSIDVTVALGGLHVEARFDAPGRGVLSIFGPSGAGKTTALRAIAGLERRARGSIRLDGETWLDTTAGTFVPVHKRGVGYVFQEASLFPHFDVDGNLRYGYRRVPTAARRIEFEEAVEWLGLGHLLRRRTTTLSGGERQRVAIARALLSSPKLLLMDEPLASLDEPSRAAILPYLTRLHETLEIPIVYVSHAVREVARLADTIVELREGRVTGVGPAPEMLHRIAVTPHEGEEPIAILDVEVFRHDEQYQLCEGRSAFGSVWIPGTSRDKESRKRIQISARDVSLGLSRDETSSILNQFAAQVVDVRETGPSQALVRLAPETSSTGPFLLSLITRKSRDTLALAPGMKLYARVKGVSVIG